LLLTSINNPKVEARHYREPNSHVKLQIYIKVVTEDGREVVTNILQQPVFMLNEDRSQGGWYKFQNDGLWLDSDVLRGMREGPLSPEFRH
jgi:hypothetical protein